MCAGRAGGAGERAAFCALCRLALAPCSFLNRSRVAKLTTPPPHPRWQFVSGPSFTMDGGLAGLLTSAHATAERHLLVDGPRASPPYPELQQLTLLFRTPDGLAAFGSLAAGGCFPALRELALVKRFSEDPLPAGLSWDPLKMAQRDRLLAELAARHEQRVEAGDWAEACGSEPPSLGEVMGDLLDLAAVGPEGLGAALEGCIRGAGRRASGWQAP